MKISIGKILTGIIIGILCCCVVVFRVFKPYIRFGSTDTASYKTIHTNNFMAGDTIELTDEGEANDKGYNSDHGFVGTIKVSVNSPKFFNSLGDVDINGTPDLSPSDLGIQDPLYMLIHLQVVNVNAKAYTSEYLRDSEAKLEPYPYVFINFAVMADNEQLDTVIIDAKANPLPKGLITEKGYTWADPGKTSDVYLAYIIDADQRDSKITMHIPINDQEDATVTLQ